MYLEPGDVLLFTKYTDLGKYGEEDEGGVPTISAQCATRACPIWAVITDPNSEYLFTYIKGGNRHAKAKVTREGPHGWHYEGYPDEYDKWEQVFDPTQWPDEVCAEVAKLRLTEGSD